MLDLAQAFPLIPDIDLDLSGCDEIGPHGLPVPVVITLERRPDRWQTARHNLTDRGVGRIIKAEAVDGQALPAALFGSLLADPMAVDQPLGHYLQMTRPAVGCFLSHLAIWKSFLRSGAERILILEDDAVLARGFCAELGRKVMAEMPPDADMVLLGCTLMDGLAEPTPDSNFVRVYYYNGTYGYILTRKGCLNLLPRLLPIETHIDNQISLELVRNRHALRVYCTEPRWIEHDFEILSDVYIPVIDADLADRALDEIFKKSRARLLRQGAKLFDMYRP
jgi:glycosyl transferase, family 25